MKKLAGGMGDCFIKHDCYFDELILASGFPKIFGADWSNLS
jgi:hypothetical protein